MLNRLWTSHHDRHGTDQPRPKMSEAEAEAQGAVHLAVTLVQWFDSGVVSQAQH